VLLSKIQSEVLRLLASQRGPESYVARATALNRDAPRYSGDIDIFHDREARVAAAALNDATILQAAGYAVAWLRQLPLLYAAEVQRDEVERDEVRRESGMPHDSVTRLEWIADSDFRFFPTMPDETFGYLLHPVDLATNKIMAAAGRREVRDLVDLLTIHQTILPLGAVVWAAVEKFPGFTPEGLIAEIRRNANYPAAEWRALQMREPIDPQAITSRLRAVLDAAEAFVIRMPTEKFGLLFLRGDKVVQPDLDRLEDYPTHAGRRRGHWPTNAEITAAMFERAAQDRSR
jgi:hypothetical protein